MTNAEQLQYINNTIILVKILEGGNTAQFVQAKQWIGASACKQWSWLLEVERVLFWLLLKDKSSNDDERAFAE